MMHPSELLSAFLDGEVTEDEQDRVAQHLVSCPACRDEIADLDSARTAVRSLRLLGLPPELVPLEGDEAEVRHLGRRPPVWIAAAAAAILALFIGVATILAPPTTLEVGLDQLSDQYGARTSLEPAITPRTPVPPLEPGGPNE